jgi:phosphatidylglycerophosphate synthase
MSLPALFTSTSPLLTLVPLVALFGVVLVAFGGFAVRTALYGRPHTPRVVKQGGTPLLGEYFMEFGLWLMKPLTGFLIRWKVSPDSLSWASLCIQLVGCWAIAVGNFGLGGWLLAIGAAFDALDGAVARARGISSDAGEVLDAAVDRWAEMAAFLAYGWYYRNDPLGYWLAGAALVGAVMVSYARAKGESFGIDAKMGLMQRHERSVYLCTATIFSAMVSWHFEPGVAFPRHYLVLIALGLIALFANITGVQRTFFIRRELRAKGR